MFRPLVLSRHPSHKILRTDLPKLGVRSLIRLGSVTVPVDGKKRVEINSVNAIKISANKRLMKQAFDAGGVPTARWTDAEDVHDLLESIEAEKVWFPLVAKHIHGSRGTGNSLLNDENDLRNWAHGRKFENYIFENYMSYMLEFRLHVTKFGCEYTCRKAILRNTDKSQRWQRHAENCVWFVENNPEFQKPNSWNDIITACVKALTSVGADILSADVKVQGELDKKGNPREYQDFFLIEVNSASSLGAPNGGGKSIVSQKYLEILPKLIMDKANA